ncbi:pectinesterase precursor [Penicillium chermesinum]|nr:pectinesterase precursor [Penicillium chermesinum]
MFKTAMPFEGLAVAVFVVCIFMAGLSIIAVLLRCFVRLGLVRGAFGWDDALMIVGLVLFIGLNSCCAFAATEGVGHHVTEFPNPDIYKETLWKWWLGQQLYLWSSAVVKISIAFALLRLAVKQWHRVILWSIVSTVIVIGLFFWLVLLFDCNPVQYFWNRLDPNYQGSCLSTKILLDVAYTYSSVTILCDFTLGGLPILMVWSLQMTYHTKIAHPLTASSASVAVVIRMPFLHHYEDADFLYSTTQIIIWSVIETGLGIIAGSLITLRPLIRWCTDGRVGQPVSENKKAKLSDPASSLPLTSPESYPLPSSQPDHIWACPNCYYPLAARISPQSISIWPSKTPVHTPPPNQILNPSQSLEELNPLGYDGRDVPFTHNRTSPLSIVSSRLSSVFRGTPYR